MDTDHDLVAAQQVALDTLGSVPGVLDDPPAMTIVHALGDSSVGLRCYDWVDQRQNSFFKVRSEAIRRVKEAFDQAGIVMAETVYRLRITDRVEAGGERLTFCSRAFRTPIPRFVVDCGQDWRGDRCGG